MSRQRYDVERTSAPDLAYQNLTQLESKRLLLEDTVTNLLLRLIANKDSVSVTCSSVENGEQAIGSTAGPTIEPRDLYLFGDLLRHPSITELEEDWD